VSAESYINPWSTQVNVNVTKDQPLLDFFRDTINITANKSKSNSASQYKYFAEGVISYHPNIGKDNTIITSANENYSGSLGEVIWNICHDYGLGIIFTENKNSFVMLIAYKRPNLTYSIFTPLPKLLGSNISDVKSLNLLISKTLKVECKLETCNLSITKDYALASGSYKNCEYLKAACNIMK
jgi:hypothetical protein